MIQGCAAGPRFLFIGDGHDLPVIDGMLQRLPVEAYGQVIIEVASEIQIRPLRAPVGIGITWLSRDRPRGFDEPIMPRGELAAQALTAWIAEWMPEQHADAAEPFVMWIGATTSPRMSAAYAELSARLEARDPDDRVDSHERHDRLDG